jgi:hypothetical protein
MAFAGPAPGLLRITATPVPLGKRRRSMSIICLRRGMMNAVPSTAPAHPASVMSQKLALPIARGMPISSSTGTVKMMPLLEVFTAEAIVCPMFVSRIDPRRNTPRSTPKPSTAAMALPLRVKPILRPA